MYEHDRPFESFSPRAGWTERIATVVGGLLGLLVLPGGIWLAVTRWEDAKVKWPVIAIAAVGVLALFTRATVLGRNLFGVFAIAAMIFGAVGAVLLVLSL